MAKGKGFVPFGKGKGKGGFGKPGKAEAAEVKKLGVKGAAREEKSESPVERRREMRGGK